MSYDLIFKRQFIKTTLGIIPTVLIGCNNLTEETDSGHDRIVRDWNLLYPTSEVLPANKLIEKVKAKFASRNEEHFKFNGKWIDTVALIKFYENGIKGAMTLEEMQRLSYSPEEVDVFCKVSISIKGIYGRRDELSERIGSTQALDWWLERAAGQRGLLKSNELCSFIIQFRSEDAIPNLITQQQRNNSRRRA